MISIVAAAVGITRDIWPLRSSPERDARARAGRIYEAIRDKCRQKGAALVEEDITELPATESHIRKPIHAGAKAPAAPDRQLVNRGAQPAMTPCRADVSVVDVAVKAVGRTISALLIHKGASVKASVAALIVGKVLSPSVGTVKRQPIAESVRELRFESVVVSLGRSAAIGDLVEVRERNLRSAARITGRRG